MKYFFIILFLFSSTNYLCAQHEDPPYLKKYFRLHPFNKKFSTFLTSLQIDPWFTVEDKMLRSDSNLFFLTGKYKNFNPFHFPAKEVKLTVAEVEFFHSDSLKTLDTSVYIQLTGVAGNTNANKESTKKEFKKFQQSYGKHFWNYSASFFGKANDPSGEKLDYYTFPRNISSISIAWGRLSENSDYIFIITLRCKVLMNTAYPLLSPEEKINF